jgi:hypothetical protein
MNTLNSGKSEYYLIHKIADCIHQEFTLLWGLNQLETIKQIGKKSIAFIKIILTLKQP